ncbi:MAG: restriction endonuclease subunit S, partial [Oscillospiraceae bacterium]
MKQYDKYKDSKIEWLGQIPEHWEEYYLSQCAVEQNISNKDVHHQNLLSLSYGSIKRKNINKTDGLLPASFDTYQIVNKGNIILRLTDLQNDKRSLRTGLAIETGIITSAYVCLRCLKHINPSFLHKVLHIYDVKKLFYGLGGGLRQGCSYKDLKKLLVYAPSAVEQEQIVRYLDWKVSLINKYVREKKQEVALLKELKNAEINRAVTRGLNQNIPLKDSGIDWIGKIPKHWEIKNFSHHFS